MATPKPPRLTPERERQPWDQREGETDAAYRLFCVYRDQGPDRSLLSAYRLRYGRRTATTLPGYVSAWSSQHAWPERAAAYDRHREQLEREAKERIWQERAAQIADTEWDTAQQLLERAREMLKYPLAEQKLDRDGQTIIVRPARWSQSDARALAETASKLMRLATGKATDRQELTGADGTPLVDAPLDLSGLTDEQLAQLRALLAIARGSRDPRGGS